MLQSHIAPFQYLLVGSLLSRIDGVYDVITPQVLNNIVLDVMPNGFDLQEVAGDVHRKHILVVQIQF